MEMSSPKCIVVGAGPGGAILSLLLARKGIPTLLLESHTDFERHFRGDTIHPSTMELMEELGLAEKLLALPHAKIRQLTLRSGKTETVVADFSRTKLRYPYITMLPQSKFIELVVGEARKYPNFQVQFHATVEGLVESNGKVEGVKFRKPNGEWTEVRALLTVGADGRSSHVRRLAGFTAVKTAPPMDVLWFKLSREQSDSDSLAGGYVGQGSILVVLNRFDSWQVGYVIPKNGYQRTRELGIPVFWETVGKLAPWLKDRISEIKDWKQVSVLSVESSRCPLWHREGVLLIGDAAHVMSPVGGVGINYAIQDAVTAANELTAPLQAGKVDDGHLAAVQKKREWPTRVIQFVQGQFQRVLVAQALKGDKPFTIPLMFRVLLKIPGVRNIPARMASTGVRPVHLEGAR